jgi:hypothetical protein
LKIPNTRRTGEEAQSVGPEFKPWYYKKVKGHELGELYAIKTSERHQC